ncbi:MAG TPA: hypothetical protein VK638_28445, partial [Edaphobacter sp.]|nr:hypothetical protein [Edaphobacter sp.]
TGFFASSSVTDDCASMTISAGESPPFDISQSVLSPPQASEHHCLLRKPPRPRATEDGRIW